MLNRFRTYFKRFITPIALAIAKHEINPNILTLSGFSISLLTPILSMKYSFPGFLIGLLLSSFFDVLDGEVARVSGRVSGFGAFLDSTCDRISDAIYIYSLSFLGLDLNIVIILIVLSLMISYTRARAESLGVKIEGVGLMERGERIIYLALISILGIFSRELMIIGAYIMIILTLYTFIERVVHVSQSMRKVSRDR
ncbi:MAG: archaetidylinositol phosphate synthase [Sulfolobales archaeon]